MSLRPSLGRGLLLRLLSGGGAILSAGVIVGVVVVAFMLITRPTAKKDHPDPPIVPGTPKKDQPGQGEVAKDNSDKDGRTYPKSPAEIVQDRLKNGQDNAARVAADAFEKGRRVAVKEDTADNADYWIWIHIKEGNWDSSSYSSGKGFNSFLACVKSKELHPNIINGDSYSYDFSTDISSSKSASYPEATVRTMGDGESTLLMAVIKSDPAKNPHRLEMLSALLDHGADPNLRFGPRAHTALMEAALDGDEAIVKCLLSHGANKSLKDLDKEAAIDCTQSESLRALLK